MNRLNFSEWCTSFFFFFQVSDHIVHCFLLFSFFHDIDHNCLKYKRTNERTKQKKWPYRHRRTIRIVIQKCYLFLSLFTFWNGHRHKKQQQHNNYEVLLLDSAAWNTWSACIIRLQLSALSFASCHTHFSGREEESERRKKNASQRCVFFFVRMSTGKYFKMTSKTHAYMHT